MTNRADFTITKQPDYKALGRPKREFVEDAILMGAAMFAHGRKVDEYNPFPDMPGFFVFRKGFVRGWNNSREVLWRHSCPGEPVPPPNSLIW